MSKTDTHHIDNPTQTKLQQILFALYDLNRLGSASHDKHLLQEQIENLEDLEQELFPRYEYMGVMYHKHISGYYYIPDVSMKFKTHKLIKDWIETDIKGEF